MVMTFPLGPDDFLGQLLVEETTYHLGAELQHDETEDGEILTADRGPRLWQGEVKLGSLTRAEITAHQTLIDAMLYAGRGFWCHDRNRPFPILDPAGAALAGYSPVIDALPAGNRSLRLSGLPPHYVLSRGDGLAWDYYNEGPRRARHAVLDLLVAADGSGVTPAFEVSPFIRQGAVAGAAVMLGRAACRAVIDAKSVTVGRARPGLGPGGGFRWRQQLAVTP